jgi:hypothetical protein
MPLKILKSEARASLKELKMLAIQTSGPIVRHLEILIQKFLWD